LIGVMQAVSSAGDAAGAGESRGGTWYVIFTFSGCDRAQGRAPIGGAAAIASGALATDRRCLRGGAGGPQQIARGSRRKKRRNGGAREARRVGGFVRSKSPDVGRIASVGRRRYSRGTVARERFGGASM